MPREAINAMALAYSLGICTVYVHVTGSVHVRGCIVIRMHVYGAVHVHVHVGWDEGWME
jgi:hypothetical protein